MAGPTMPEVKSYLREVAQAWTDADLTEVLAAEASAQAAVCRAGTEDLPDVKDALKRRVARNLAMRALPLGVQQTGDAFNTVGSNDPEVRRLERPYRKVFVG